MTHLCHAFHNQESVTRKYALFSMFTYLTGMQTAMPSPHSSCRLASAKQSGATFAVMLFLVMLAQAKAVIQLLMSSGVQVTWRARRVRREQKKLNNNLLLGAKYSRGEEGILKHEIKHN